MNDRGRKSALLVAALAAAVAIGSACPTAAAPGLTDTAALKAAASSALVLVRHNQAGAFGGRALGGFRGAAIARPYFFSYRYYRYSPFPYGYYGPYYHGYGSTAYGY